MSVLPTGTSRSSETQHRNALPSGSKLQWYQIENVLGQGSFGITYLAKDLNLGQKVAIKEFLPTELSVREQDSSVRPVSPDKAEIFSWGLERFLSEAQTLAHFKHPNIVRVLSVFQANNTAYMIMEYEQGESLEAALKHHRIEGEGSLRAALFRILDGLERVHEAGFIHRDIKPGNIYLREDDSPVLLDFGSARQAIGAETRALTTVVTPGYAPFEQYSTNPESDKQGPWTDIYGAAATLYRAVSGRAPLDGVTRAHVILEGNPDPVEPAIEVGKGSYSPGFLAAIDRGLSFHHAERPQCVAEWRALFEASSVESYPVQATVRLPETVLGGDSTGETGTSAAQSQSGDNAQASRVQALADVTKRLLRLAKGKRFLIGLIAVLVLGLGLGLGVWQHHSPQQPAVEQSVTSDAQRVVTEIATEFFGEETHGVAEVIERVVATHGTPDGYIRGREIGGALLVGARYGTGQLALDGGASQRVFWTTPSLGIDAGQKRAVKVFALVYNLPDVDAIFKKFSSVAGSSHKIGETTMDEKRAGDTLVVPIRVGKGLPAKVGIGYIHFRRERSWNPF